MKNTQIKASSKETKTFPSTKQTKQLNRKLIYKISPSLKLKIVLSFGEQQKEEKYQQKLSRLTQ